MPASLDSLPDELLKMIVEVVSESDQRCLDLDLRYGLLSRWEGNSVELDYETAVHVAQGRWSMWYGFGVSALASVNRHLRSLAIPLLYEVRGPPLSTAA